MQRRCGEKTSHIETIITKGIKFSPLQAGSQIGLRPLHAPERNSPMVRPGKLARKGTVSGPVCVFPLAETTSNPVRAAARMLEPHELPCVEGRWRKSTTDGSIWRVSVPDPSDNRVELARWRTLSKATSPAGSISQPSRNYTADYVYDPVIFIRSVHDRDEKGGKWSEREGVRESGGGGAARGMPRVVPDESDEKLLRPASVSEKRE